MDNIPRLSKMGFAKDVVQNAHMNSIISNGLQAPEQKKLGKPGDESFNWRDILGGQISGYTAPARMLPNAMKPVEQMGRTLGAGGEQVPDFEPYKAVGTEDRPAFNLFNQEEPFTTRKGQAQLASELLTLAPTKLGLPSGVLSRLGISNKAISKILKGGMDLIPHIKNEGLGLGKFKDLSNALTDVEGAKEFYDTAAPSVINPGLLEKEYMKSLGSGTSEENANRVAQEAWKALHGKNEEHLAMRNEAINAYPQSDIFKEPMKNIAEGNLPQVAAVFNNKEKATPKQLSALKGRITSYRKHGDVNQFIDEASDIFNPINDLTHAQENLVENMLAKQPKNESNFLSDQDFIKKYILGGSNGIQEKYEKYMNRRTLKNADELLKGLHAERAERGRVDNANKYEIDQAFQKAIKDHKSDMDLAFKRLPKEVKEKYNNSLEFWKKHVFPYKTENVLRDIYYKRKPEDVKGFTPSQLLGTFAYPTPEVEQVMQNMGEEGRKALLSLGIGQHRGESPLSDVIPDLMQNKGLGKNITPEDLAIAKEMQRRGRNKALAKGAAVGGAALTGHPWLAGTLGTALFYDPLRTILRKLNVK